MSATKQNNYEIMYIVDDQNPELAAELKKEFLTILTNNNGKVTKEEDFVRQFAYEINHKVQGHYFILQVLTAPENIAEFRKNVFIKQKQNKIIRDLVINLDEEPKNRFKERKERPENLDHRENREFRPRRPYNPEHQSSDYKGKAFNPRFKKEKPTEKTIKPNTEVSQTSKETK